MDVMEEKTALRKRMKTLRAGMDIASYRSLSMAIMIRCLELPEYRRAGTVHVYVSSLNNEADTTFIYKMFDEGKRVVVPVCAAGPRTLRHVRIDSIEALRPGRFGVMEPYGDGFEVVRPGGIDIILAPMLRSTAPAAVSVSEAGITMVFSPRQPAPRRGSRIRFKRFRSFRGNPTTARSILS